MLRVRGARGGRRGRREAASRSLVRAPSPGDLAACEIDIFKVVQRPEAAPGAPSLARRWAAVTLGPAAPPGTRLWRRRRRPHVCTRISCVVKKEDEIYRDSCIVTAV